MILIRVSETGFVSGQAWETVGYQGDINSRIIHTILNKPDFLEDVDNYQVYYKIKSKILNRVVEVALDQEMNVAIPPEFMKESQRLWFQLLIKIDGSEDRFFGNPFHLDIDSSLGPDAEVILKPNANNFIVVDSIVSRDSIPRDQLADGKVVKVNKVGFYTWDNDTTEWIEGALEISDVRNLQSTLDSLDERITALEQKNNT